MSLAALQSRLQTLVAASPLLAAAPPREARPVLIEDKNNLVSLVETTLATQSLCVVIAPESGTVKDGALPRRAGWSENLEIAIHRGLVDADDVPSTVAVMDDLRARLHGAEVDPARPAGLTFSCVRHELRESGDGTYVRVLIVTTVDPLNPPAP